MNDTRQVQVVIVEVPSAGTPEPQRSTKPGPYKRNSHEAWRPATRPPSKAERLGRFLDSINQQEAELRKMLTPSPRAWFDLPPKDAGA